MDVVMKYRAKSERRLGSILWLPGVVGAEIVSGVSMSLDKGSCHVLRIRYQFGGGKGPSQA